MERTFAQSLVVGRAHDLPGGPRVRVRLAQPRDARRVGALAARQGHELTDLELARLVRFDPRREAAIVASALVDGADRLVGVGRIVAGVSTPELLITDSELPGELAELLREALVSRAGALRRAAA